MTLKARGVQSDFDLLRKWIGEPNDYAIDGGEYYGRWDDHETCADIEFDDMTKSVVTCADDFAVIVCNGKVSEYRIIDGGLYASIGDKTPQHAVTMWRRYWPGRFKKLVLTVDDRRMREFEISLNTDQKKAWATMVEAMNEKND